LSNKSLIVVAGADSKARNSSRLGQLQQGVKVEIETGRGASKVLFCKSFKISFRLKVQQTTKGEQPNEKGLYVKHARCVPYL
jgi:hypothetical protein